MEEFIPVLIGLVPVLLTSILGWLVRISRQLTRIVQYFDSKSPVSEAMGGTLPVRLKAVEDWKSKQEFDDDRAQ